MKVFYAGDMFEIQNIQFDLVGQMYCVWLKGYRVLDFWRREGDNIGIKTKDIWVYIATNTPHIAKMTADGESVERICNEIGLNILSYIDYAFNNKNAGWVKYVANDGTISIDRITKDDIAKALNLSDEDVRNNMIIFKAY